MRGEDIYYLWITNHRVLKPREREWQCWAGGDSWDLSGDSNVSISGSWHNHIVTSQESVWQGLQLSPGGQCRAETPLMRLSRPVTSPRVTPAYYCERPPLASRAAQHLSEDTLFGSDPVNINKKSLRAGSEMLDGHFIISISPFFAGHHISARWQLSQVWTEDCNVFLVIRGLLTNTDHGQSEYLCTLQIDTIVDSTETEVLFCFV